MYSHPYPPIRESCSGPAKKDGNSSGLETRFSTLGVTAAQRTAPEVEYTLVQKRQQYVSVTLVTYTYSYCQVVLVVITSIFLVIVVGV